MSCEGIRVSKRSVSDAGICNFCHRMHRMVYEMQGSHPSCTLVVRMCSKCIGELKKKT